MPADTACRVPAGTARRAPGTPLPAVKRASTIWRRRDCAEFGYEARLDGLLDDVRVLRFLIG